MGGVGSGNFGHPYPGTAQRTTQEYPKIDIRDWLRRGLLAPDRMFTLRWGYGGRVVLALKVSIEAGWVRLEHHYDNEVRRYSVRLDWLPCHFGGRQPYFLCPAKGCGRRITALYGAAVFACRHCQRLVYPCQHERADDRAARQANKIRERLGWEPGILNGEGDKPPGMSRKVYNRLVAKYDALACDTLEQMELRYGIKL